MHIFSVKKICLCYVHSFIMTEIVFEINTVICHSELHIVPYLPFWYFLLHSDIKKQKLGYEWTCETKKILIRPKKVGLFLEIGRVKKKLSPTRPHESNVYENIYFLCQKTRTQTKKFQLANLFVWIYVFFLSLVFQPRNCC